MLMSPPQQQQQQTEAAEMRVNVNAAPLPDAATPRIVASPDAMLGPSRTPLPLKSDGLILHVQCNCRALRRLSDAAATPSHYCTHSATHCYELPATFSLLPNAMASGVGVCSDRKYLADHRRWWPPPVFIIAISLLEIGVFAYDYATVMPPSRLSSTRIPSESLLIYRPDRRLQIWRFLTYMALHANCFHLGLNVIVQLLYGLPLETVHGSARIAAIYLAGVLAGSLGTSVIDSEVYLVGASGGVYALLAAQLANVMMNFGQMRYGAGQLLAVLIFVFCDIGYAFYGKYLATSTTAGQDFGDLRDLMPTVSYMAHLSGSLAGFTLGLVVLNDFEDKHQTQCIRWLALGVYASFSLFALAFNLVNTVAAQQLEEEGEVIRQHLLHKLGIS